MTRLTRVAALLATSLVLAACGTETDTGEAPGQTEEVAQEATDAEQATDADDTAAGADAEVAEEPAVDRPSVVATTTIVADLVADVAGDAVSVTSLIPPGADPHDVAPSAAQAAELRSADLVVAIGGNLEEGFVDLLASAEQDGVRVLELVDVLDDPLEPGASDHGHDDHGDDDHGDDDHGDDDHGDDDHGDDEHDHGDVDPHLWLDPVRTAGLLDDLAAELLVLAPGSDVAERADARAAELLALDEQLRTLMADVPAERRVLVTDHDAFGYWADRYDFEVIAVRAGGESGATPARFAELVTLVRDAGLPAVFAESLSDDRLVRALADEAGDVEVGTLFSDALDEGAGGYDELLTENATRIASALG